MKDMKALQNGSDIRGHGKKDRLGTSKLNKEKEEVNRSK